MAYPHFDFLPLLPRLHQAVSRAVWAELDRQATAHFIAHGPTTKPTPIAFPGQRPKAKPAISGLYTVCPERWV